MLVGHRTHLTLFQGLIKKEALASGYIFYGPKGVGKRTFAESLAHFLEGRPFEPSEHILQEALIIQTGEDSIGIEAARKVKAFLRETPLSSNYRTVIIDNANQLTTQAENALLKIAEEAPPYALIIFITAVTDNLLGTLTSRLQKIYFSPVSSKELASLMPKTTSEKERAAISKTAMGIPGRAIALLSGEDPILQAGRKVMTAGEVNRKKVIKEYLDTEQSPSALVDAIILLAREDTKNRKTVRRALEVKRHLATLNVNPRLQLESIFS